MRCCSLLTFRQKEPSIPAPTLTVPVNVPLQVPDWTITAVGLGLLVGSGVGDGILVGVLVGLNFC